MDTEDHYYATMKDLHESKLIDGEMCCVGAGTGGGFINMNELKVMKSKDSMKTGNEAKWQIVVDDEHI
jgi:hypothetical protein